MTDVANSLDQTKALEELVRQELAAQDSVEYEDVGDLVLPLHTDAPAPAAAVKAPLPFEPPYLSSHESLPFAHQRRVSGLENIPENGSMRRAMSAQPSRSRSAGRGPSASNSQRSQRPASGISSGASEKLGVYTREGAVSHRFIDLDAAPKLPPHSPNAYYYGAGGRTMSLSGSNFSLPERAASYRSNSAHLISNRSVSASRASTTSRVSSVSRAPIPQGWHQPGAKSRTTGRIQSAPNTKTPECLGDVGNFNSPLKVRSYKDFTPLLGYRIVPPLAGINDNVWVLGRPPHTFSAPSREKMRDHQPSAFLDRSHTFHEQVAIGEENGRLVRRISHIMTRNHDDPFSHAPKPPVKHARTKPCHIANGFAQRAKAAEVIVNANTHLHNRILTMKPSRELSRTAAEKDFMKHLEYKEKLKKIPAPASAKAKK